MRKPAPYDGDARGLGRRLFATATGILGRAAEITIAGQHPGLTNAGCIACAEEPKAAADGLAVLANAAIALAKPAATRPEKPISRRRFHALRSPIHRIQ